MRNCKTIDIEDELQKALNIDGIKAAAPPVPANLAPSVFVYRTGGFSQAYVQDVNTVDFDIYARTEAEAMARACNLTEWTRALPERQLEGATVYFSDITTLPYNNPDPNNPTLPRATFSAQIGTRVTHRKETA